jgi:hypothetical protein
MSYGIEIRNQYGEIILDNTPYSVMKIVDGYPLTAARNISKDSATFNCSPGEVIFIRASNNGTVGGSAGYANLAGISTGSGDLTYVKIVSCENLTASGYGLAVFSNEGTPKLVFSDSIKFAKLAYSNYMSLPAHGSTTVSIPPVSAGMNRYVSLTSFGICGTYNSSDVADVFSASFGYNTVTFTAVQVGFGQRTFTADAQFPISITIIEC